MFQQAAVIYHARLNAAHFEREMVPLNAFFGFLTTLRTHCKKIAEVVEQPSLAQFAEVIKSQFDWYVLLVGWSANCYEFTATSLRAIAADRCSPHKRPKSS